MKQSSSKNLTVVACQTRPQINKKKENIDRFDKVIAHLKIEDGIDLVIFPQMAFTGYNFANSQQALPNAVAFKQGIQFEYAKELSLKLKCYVLFGYIEKAEQQGNIVLYNSAAMCNREGQFFFNTRKTHLYYADQLWAKEGPGFKTVQIKNREGKSFNCAVGICMDINPKGFTSGKFEFADFIKEKDCQVILFPTNWIDHDRSRDKTSFEIYNFWLQRLTPLLKPKSNKMRYFVGADRAGKEYSYREKEDQHFLGSSAMLSINPHSLVGKYLDKDSESFIKTQLKLPE